MNCKTLLTAAGSLVAVAAFSQNQRPNILFCIADDASMWTFGTYGYEFSKTPAIDALAENGVRFDNAFTPNPKSAPSRAMLVTGKYSWQLKEATNHYCHFPSEFKFYPSLLQESGYHVGYTGKGWGPGVYDSKDNPAGPVYNDITNEVPYKGIRNVDYSANFNAFLDEKESDEPFCFWFGTLEPHRFYEKDSWKKAGYDLAEAKVQPFLPDNDITRGDFLDYLAEVEWLDTHIGKAVESLRERGLLENTIIVVTSDHGMPFPRIKGQIYEEGFHVPFIVSWQGVTEPGRVVTDFIGFPDVAPTFMEAAGLEPHEQMTGRSFLDVLKSKKSGQVDKSRDHMLICKERHDVGRASENVTDLAYPVRAIRTADYLYIHNIKPELWPVGNPEYDYKNCDPSPSKSYLTSLQPEDSDYEYFVRAFGKRQEEELYDIQNDPHCMNNLADNLAYAKTKSKLRKQMEKELIESGDPRMLGEGEQFDKYPYMGKQFDYSKKVEVTNW
ncbi:MAG: sulfatase [Rikenellaceae bacterium]